MAQTVQQALAQTALFSDGRDYVVIKLPARAITAAAGVIAEIGEPFGALIVDKDEVTLVIPAEALEDFIKRLPGHAVAEKHYRLITFDGILDFTLVGFMAVVSQALAKVGISILPVAAYSRDHLLVPADQVEVALKTLEQLKSGN
ncbi:MAG TPA: ACT domain-containing protein [Phototrophicaceae bacterium]|nr:ACT domain-containing protein [Phototrophicaceae bacterium]